MGFWARTDDVDAFSDLWTEVAEGIDNTRGRIAATGDTASVHAVAGVIASEVSLTQFSRVPLWLLGLED